MHKRLKLNGIYYRVKANFQGDSTCDFSDDNYLHNKFKISITNLETKKRIYFNFFDSIANYQANKQELTRDDLIFALYCFLSDSISGYYTFENFINEYGYNDQSLNEYPRIKKIYNACINSRKKADKIGLYSENILCDTVNYIQNKFNV